MYGAGALLIREVARRTGGGWPMIGLLAVAYALMEEGPIDQLLWNDSYAGQDLLHGPSFLPSVGMSVELTQIVIALHAVWSISVPIALVESMVPDRAMTPWLGRRGLRVVAATYVLGAVVVFLGNYEEERFLASPAQLISITVVIVALVAAAMRVRSLRLTPVAGGPPSPIVVGAAALGVTSLYWGTANLMTADRWEWAGVAAWTVCAALIVGLIPRWSRQTGWGPAHRLSLAAGATLTYAWVAFPVRPESGGSARTDLIGNVAFGLVALAVVARAGWRVRGAASVEGPGEDTWSVRRETNAG